MLPSVLSAKLHCLQCLHEYDRCLRLVSVAMIPGCINKNIHVGPTSNRIRCNVFLKKFFETKFFYQRVAIVIIIYIK